MKPFETSTLLKSLMHFPQTYYSRGIKFMT